jgi:hypothetical protein
MLGVDPEFGASLARLWIAAGSAALLVVLCAVAFLQPQVRLAANPALRIGFVVAGAVFGAVMTWAFLDRAILAVPRPSGAPLNCAASSSVRRFSFLVRRLRVSMLWSARVSRRPARNRCLHRLRLLLRRPLTSARS